MQRSTRRALCRLESALGWKPRKRAKLEPNERIKDALHSAKVANLFDPPDWQLRLIKKAEKQLRSILQGVS